MYNNDRLVAITHNGFTYNLAYDIWGQLTSVSVGDTTIISYKYGSGVNRDRITQSIYHNGDFEDSSTTTIKYEYKNGNVSKVRVNNVVKYLYEYDSQGNLSSVSEINSRTVKYTDGRTDIIDYKTKDVIYSSYTNDDGDLIEVINGVTYTSKSYDSAYDIATGITTEFSDVSASNGKVIGTVDKQDWFGRYTESIVKTESANDTSTENNFASVKTEYTYPEYEENKTSNRIESYLNTITYGTDTSAENKTNFYGFAYDYDNNGNIIAEYKQGVNGAKALRYSYVYDELNQLVRVNDKASNTTYTYTYDGAGNIVSKAEYIYTTDETITDEAEKVTNYTYDTIWKDKLATYDGKAFTYDNIGNPLTFDGASFTWMGRELTQYTKDGKEITFQYDENGLRHRKIVKENDVVVEQYDYVWSDGSLISQTYTSFENENVLSTNTARFIYDSWGTLQGFILNDSETYLYVKNLQGDIIAIVDEKGQTIVEYSYDAWGNVTFHETSLQNMTKASTLCFVSPFTYRGYCYDYDIELYYLQSRYYSAEIGRFINTDDTQIAVATMGTVLGANLFAYCENNAVNYTDHSGYAVFTGSLTALMALAAKALAIIIETLVYAIIAIIAVTVFVALFKYFSDSQVRSNIKINSTLTRTLTNLKILGALAKTLLIKIYLALKAVYDAVKSVTKAVAKTKTKIKKEKNRYDYWVATLVTYGKDLDTFIPTKALPYSSAISYVRAGGSVFADSKSNAYKLAVAVGNGKAPTKPERHSKNGSTLGFWWHYHDGNRKGGHIFYV